MSGSSEPLITAMRRDSKIARMGVFHVKAELPLLEIKSRYESGETVSSLAKSFGVGFGTMQRHLKDSGAVMRKNSWNRFDLLRDEWVRRYLNEKASLKQLATESGVDYATVRRYLLESGVTLRADSSVPAYEHESPCAGSIRVRGTWEAAYAKILDCWFLGGKIAGWSYESERVPMSGLVGEWYSPDFKVVGNDGSVCFHEIKGFLRERAMAKVAAARGSGFRVVLITGRVLSSICGYHGIKVKV